MNYMGALCFQESIPIRHKAYEPLRAIWINWKLLTQHIQRRYDNGSDIDVLLEALYRNQREVVIALSGRVLGYGCFLIFNSFNRKKELFYIATPHFLIKLLQSTALIIC